MPLLDCEGSQSSACVVHQRGVRELGPVVVMRLLRVPQILVLVVSVDTLTGTPAAMVADTLCRWASENHAVSLQFSQEKVPSPVWHPLPSRYEAEVSAATVQ